MGKIGDLLRNLADLVDKAEGSNAMPVIWDADTLAARMLASRDQIDADGEPGRLEIMAADGTTPLAGVTLGYPGDATAIVHENSLTFAGFPRSDLSVDVDGRAASARVVSASGKSVGRGLSVGVAGDGNDYDVVLSKLDLKVGEILRIASFRIGSAGAPPGPVITPPKLILPQATATSPTTAEASVVTDDATGTLYCYASPNPTESVSLIKASGIAKPVTVAGQHDFALTALAAASTLYAHFVQTDADGADSQRVTSLSFSTPAPSDTTAPALSLFGATVTGTTSATLGVTTNEGNGRLYAVVTTSPIPPSVVQIQAGQNNAGTAAAFQANQVISSAGAKSFNATGLQASTAYYAYFQQQDGSGNNSVVVGTAIFTTAAGPVLSGASAVQTGATTATLGVTTNNATGSLYSVVTTNATKPTSLQIRTGLDHTGAAAAFANTAVISSAGAKVINATGLAASTVYFAHFVHRDNTSTDSAIVSSSSFTTAATPPVDPPAPPPVFTNVLKTILTDTGADGPSQTCWSMHLGQRWVNTMGDWLDSAGTPQGAVPFSSILVSAVGEYALDVTAIVRSGNPIFLKLTGKNSPSARFDGRGGANPPRIVATNSAGAQVPVSVLAYACWNSSSASASDTYLQGSISSIANGAVSYEAGPDVQSAILYLTCNFKSSATGTLAAYQCNAPVCRIAGGGATPALGIASEVADEEALKTHPDVLWASGFNDTSMLNSITYFPPAVPEYLDDPDSPGTGRKILRNKFDPSQHDSMTFQRQLTTVDTTDIRRPILHSPPEMFQRAYVMMEDSFLGVSNDAQKLFMGWDFRFGYWVDGRGFQNLGGNGGIPGTGLKYLRPADYYPSRNDDPKNNEFFEYQGHSARAEFDRSPDDPAHPYRRYRPVQIYVYHLDQPGDYGSASTAQGACVEIGSMFCLEWQIKMNSVSGPLDDLGNGTANPDGEMRLWLDGVLCYARTNWRWRRNEEMGLEGPWNVNYFGGRGYPPIEAFYRIKDYACATRYIGMRNVGAYPAGVNPPSNPPDTSRDLAPFAASIGLAASPSNRWIDTGIVPGGSWAVKAMVEGGRDATREEVEPGPADVGNFNGTAPDTLVNSCGAAWFPNQKRFYWYGGGHGGWMGNEVYWVDVPSKTWGRLNDPSAIERWPEGPTGWGWKVVGGGAPMANHTYNGIVAVESQNCFYALFGSPWPDGGFPNSDIWRFNVITKVWTKMLSNALAPVSYGRGTEAHYIPSQGKIAIGRPNFWRWYDPFSNTLGPILNSQSTLSNGNSVATSTGIYSFGSGGTCFFVPYANIGIAAPTSINTTTHPRIRSHPRWADAAWQWNSFLWDATRGMVIAWASSYNSEPTTGSLNKGKQVYAIDFANDHLYEFVVSGGTWATSQSLGSYTKWQHLVELDCYIGLNNRAENNGWMVFKPGALTQLT